MGSSVYSVLPKTKRSAATFLDSVTVSLLDFYRTQSLQGRHFLLVSFWLMFVFDNVFLCWGLSYVLCRRPSSRVRPQHRHGLGLGLLDQREQRTALQLGQWEAGWSHGLRQEQNHEAWRQQGRVRRERQRWQWAGCWWAWWRQSWGWSVGVTVVGRCWHCTFLHSAG